jgi:hypothetical protein
MTTSKPQPMSSSRRKPSSSSGHVDRESWEAKTQNLEARTVTASARAAGIEELSVTNQQRPRGPFVIRPEVRPIEDLSVTSRTRRS